MKGWFKLYRSWLTGKEVSVEGKLWAWSVLISVVSLLLSAVALVISLIK